MLDRETRLPLAFAFILAVGVHVGAAAGFVALRGEDGAARQWRPPDPPDRQREPRLGDPEQRSLTANWISYEDYQELLARRSQVDQAAAQRVVEAAPVERTPLDPTPPAPRQDPAPPQPPETQEPPETPEVQEAAEPPDATEPRPVEAADAEPEAAPADPELAGANPERPATIPPLAFDAEPEGDPLLPLLAEADAPELTESELGEMIAALAPRPEREVPNPPAPSPEADAPDAARDSADAAEQTARRPPAPRPAARSDANPTAAPRDDREAPPASRTDSERVRPGEVLGRQGIRIQTAQLRPSMTALRSSAPANPAVEVTFDPSGHVVAARIIRSSGYANVDAPVLTSLYRWRASGEPLERRDGPFTVEIELILTRR